MYPVVTLIAQSFLPDFQVPLPFLATQASFLPPKAVVFCESNSRGCAVLLVQQNSCAPTVAVLLCVFVHQQQRYHSENAGGERDAMFAN